MLNHIEHIPADNDYVVSMKNLGGLARIDGATGETEWILGSTHHDIVPDTVFARQHGFDMLDEDHLLLFDNDGGPTHSRVLSFELDRDNGTATTIREYEDELTSFVMGDVTEHPNGNIRIAWSTTGRIDEVNPDGQRVSRLTFSEVRTVGYLSVYDAIGPTP
jgi:hypothetical protein